MDSELGHCSNCGQNRHVFTGPTAAMDFCNFLFEMKHAVAIAHDVQGFDSHFNMQYLAKQDIALKIITRGLEIMSLQVGSVKLVDSFNFFPRALPEAFEKPELKRDTSSIFSIRKPIRTI